MSVFVNVEYFCSCDWAVCGGHCVEERIRADEAKRSKPHVARPLMSTWTRSVEDVLQSAKEQRGQHPPSGMESREELVKFAGALLLMVQEMDEVKESE